EDLNELIKRKEEQLREKEKYLREKEKELDARTKGIIEKEIAMSQEEIVSEIKEQKVKTGTRRLDDLLYGGFPLGSNIIVYGPAYTGKEVLIYSFLAEGLKKGIPALVILTDKTIEIFEEDVKYVLPTWDTYVENGLVKYLDAYSKTIGEKSDRKNVIYIDSQTDINGIVEGIDKIVSELKSNYKYYRLAFFSLSTILTFLDAPTVVRFLQPFTTKRKKERAVSLYLLEKGLHEENAIQLVSHLMDGTIEFKLEMGKVYLQVNGITEAQSRSWIEISPSKSGIIMGSFTLGHIR
ncbi:MAG: ATPase domain-containing protein, partial [Thermoplasmata archaeon]